VKSEDKSSRAPIGEGAKRATLAAVGMLLLLCSIIALPSRELLWSGVFAVPAAITFWIAIWGKSAAVKKASSVVEHSAFTLHVPGKTPRETKSESGGRDSEGVS
jgi:hypothetical protein